MTVLDTQPRPAVRGQVARSPGSDGMPYAIEGHRGPRVQVFSRVPGRMGPLLDCGHLP